MKKKSFNILLISLLVGIFLSIGINFSVGYAPISLASFFTEDDLYHSVAMLRTYRVLAMILVGISIPTSGFILQEYFQNPLAGPSVLGISSVASLAVALFIFVFQNVELPQFAHFSGMSMMAISGSILMMFVLLAFSHRFRDTSHLIIFGFLISALAGAIISLLQLYAENQQLKNYILWSFGANALLNGPQIIFLSILTLVGIVFSFFTIKPLIGSVLGDQYARSFGVNATHLKWWVIISSSILSAGITAFLGPILFIGIVIPHFSRLLYSPSQLWHQWILNMVLGVLVLQVFSILSELFTLPINVITSLIGIPVIFLMMIKSKK